MHFLVTFHKSDTNEDICTALSYDIFFSDLFKGIPYN